MNRGFFLTMVMVSGFTAASLSHAQAAPASSDQSNPAAQNKKPAAAQPTPQTGANPFPEDTSNVPVMPSKGTVTLPEGTYTGPENGAVALPGDDLDPVRSPDDPIPSNAEDSGSSSSLAGLDKLLPKPGDDDQSDKHRKLNVKEPTHQEAASEDVTVGGYYLDKKNWKAALSRFESAMVLDPDNPEVYWGLAESDRHLGALAEARGYYEKVVDYDPDSKHGKEARKALKEPEIANAKATAPPAVGQSLAGGSQK
jgi:tetratricopeptide (TPR) repeat protein